MKLRLRPSSAHRWGNGKCTRFPHFAALIPYKDNGMGDEGTCAHWVLESYMTGVVLPIGTPHTNGTLVNEEMHLHAIEYLKLMALVGRFSHDLSNLGVVVRDHTAQWVSEAKYEMFYGPYNGIIDCWLYNPTTHTLYVYDYKYGRVPVAAFENEQLISYAQTLVVRHNIPTEGLRIYMGIYQPRAFKGEVDKSWSLTYGEFVGHVNLMIEAVNEVNAGGVCRVGSHCAYCPALANGCPSSEKALEAAMRFEELGDMHKTNVEELGNELMLLEALCAHLGLRKNAVESEVKELINQGKTVNGWGLESIPGKNEWTVPVEHLKALEPVYGVELTEVVAKVTPTQAKKLPIPKDVLQAFSKRKANWFKLSKTSTFNPFAK